MRRPSAKSLIFCLVVAIILLGFILSRAGATETDECPTFNSVHKEINIITGFQDKKELDWFFNALKYLEKHPSNHVRLRNEEMTKEEQCQQMRIMRTLFLEEPSGLASDIRQLMIEFPGDYKTFAIEYWGALEEEK